jgi:3-methyl-2-oxobutanoate hydroxymethyltransferase
MSQPITVPAVRARKVPSTGAEGVDAEPLVMVTAYDTPTARIADNAGVDLILVGDSVAMVVLGYDDTLQVTVEDMVHHTEAVARARTRAMVVADLPWLSYHVSPQETVHNAGRLLRAGARAVKLEGGRKRVPMVSALVDAEIPVMGHVGLTPQSVRVTGGYRVQARDPAAAVAVVEDAMALAAAVTAVAAYAADVRGRRFPSEDETYHLLEDVSDSKSQPSAGATPLTASRGDTGDRRAS